MKGPFTLMCDGCSCFFYATREAIEAFSLEHA